MVAILLGVLAKQSRIVYTVKLSVSENFLSSKCTLLASKEFSNWA
jgi:hypothetical protein